MTTTALFEREKYSAIYTEILDLCHSISLDMTRYFSKIRSVFCGSQLDHNDSENHKYLFLKPFFAKRELF